MENKACYFIQVVTKDSQDSLNEMSALIFCEKMSLEKTKMIVDV